MSGIGSYDSLDSLPTSSCAQCLQDVNDPRLLPCLHSFCRACIDTLAVTAPEVEQAGDGEEEEKELRCPLCRQTSKLPREGASSLAKDWTRLLSRDTSHGERPVCEICTEERKRSPPSFWCSNCRVAVCSDHLIAHLKSAGGVCPVEQLAPEQGTPPGTRRDSRAVMFQKCIQHGQELRYYCTPCQKTVCGDCILPGTGEHTGSAHEPVKRAREMIAEQRQKAREELERLEENVLPSLQEPLETCRGALEKLEERSEEVREKIREAEQRLLAEVKTHAELMLERVDDLSQKHRKALDCELDDLKSQASSVSNAISFAKRLVQQGRLREDLIPLLQAFELRSASLLPNSDNRQLPLPHGNFLLTTAEDFQAKAQAAMGSVCWLQASASHSSVNHATRQVVEGGEAVFILRLMDDDSRTVKDSNGDDVNVCVLETPANVDLSVNVDGAEDGSLRISCSPPVAGNYQLQVSINGEKMSSPLRIKCTRVCPQWKFDPSECDSCLEISLDHREAKRPNYAKKTGHMPSALGLTGMRYGQHSWKVQLSGSPTFHIVGVATKPLGSTNDNYAKTHSWHGSSFATHNVHKLQPWKDGDVLQFNLDCDSHTLRVENLRSSDKGVISNLPDEDLFQYFCARSPGNGVKFLTEDTSL